MALSRKRDSVIRDRRLVAKFVMPAKAGISNA